MAKLKHLTALVLFLTLCCGVHAQYDVQYRLPDADSVQASKLSLTKSFASRTEAGAYVTALPSLLQSKGYMTASLDTVQLDSSAGFITLFLGQQYKWAHINYSGEREWLEAVSWPSLPGSPMNFTELEAGQQRLLDYFEDKGYPFARVFLDSIALDGSAVSALLRIERGPLYRIDSIRIYGDAKVSNTFLQRYLDLPNGSPYNKNKLAKVSKKLGELSYVTEERPSDLTLLGTGSVLNLYLKQKKSSQANALIGFLPNSNGPSGKKVQLAVDANILLRNSLGNSETIGLLWQQLQEGSPRLNILFEQPYVFRSPFGLHFSFDMYRKDSTFLNLLMNLGVHYKLEERQTLSVFLQRRSSMVNSINTAFIMQNRRLPEEADVSSVNLGLGYAFNNTDYRLNPRKGSDLAVTTSAGNKKVRKNNAVLELKDPADPSFKFERLYDTVKLSAYQVRVTVAGSRFFPLGRQATFRLGLNAGLYQSATYFRNELFQIGGHKLLRGFNEESQYVSRYSIGTAEYRYLLTANSNVFAFVDGGWGDHVLEKKQHLYLGTGLGLSFETGAGIFNLIWAVGKRDDTEINLRQSKVHLGFVSYF